MALTQEKIEFDHKGIGMALAHQRLVVPLNQREYSWEEEHVRELINDLKGAIAYNQGTYFLGTIVLTRGNDVIPEVADGQQRLATTTILLAAIRDYLWSIDRKLKVESIERSFLLGIDYKTEEIVPRLRLNVDDHEYFIRRILSRPDSPDRAIAPARKSHERIDRAAEIAAAHVQEIVSYYGSGGIDQLTTWVEFLENSAQVMLLTVPDHLNAFVMFETLNDRGLKASQADLLKNHILSLADDRIAEAQQKWAHMLGILEATGNDDTAVTYLRHLMITMHGPTKERELFGKVKHNINSKATALAFAGQLANRAVDYAALFEPEHAKWNDYGTSTRKHIRTLLQLEIEQIRPLLFAVAKHFSIAEAQKAFRLFVSWSVRFLIVGGRGGLLDRHYSLRAHEVGIGTITTAKQLVDAMIDVVPPDAVFESAFASARVSKAHLARYYLRALEQQRAGASQPELVPNDNEEQINLEHVLPENPDSAWNINPDTAAAYYRRIGNMVLLQARQNTSIGNRPFTDKQPILQSSAFSLTQDVGNYPGWDAVTINERQRDLAALAVKTWPIEVR